VIFHQNRCCQQQYELAIAPCSNFSPQKQQAVLLQLPEIFGDRLEPVLGVSPNTMTPVTQTQVLGFNLAGQARAQGVKSDVVVMQYDREDTIAPQAAGTWLLR